MRSNDEKWGLFWCGLLHEIIFEELDGEPVNRCLASLSKKEFLFPNGKRKKPSLSTLRRKLRQFKQDGFSSLARKRRSDCGRPRAIAPEIIARAVELKKEQPFRSDDALNRFLDVEFGKTIPKSTLYRHLKLKGATKIKLDVTKRKVRKRWTRDQTHDLWVGDFEEGPFVFVNGEVLPTHLSLFIDCHSRYVVEGRYYLRQNLDILIDSLLRAWSVHGTSKELYVDNAKVYHANALKAACYSLNINLLHRAPRDPPPGGLVERIFGTCQSQFEAEVRAGDILSLEELNTAFVAYLEVAYHPKIHSETGQAPKERYERALTVIRHVNLSDAAQYFMKKEFRTVDKDFSDIRLNRRFYRVDRRLRRDKVQVHYDPFTDMSKVWIYSLNDEYLGQGVLYQRDYGDDAPTPEKAKPKNNYLELLKQRHAEQLREQSRGIDFRKVVSQRSWPFAAFVQKLSKLMGRKEGLAAFSSEEYEILKKNYDRIACLNESMLLEAWEKAEKKTIPHLVYQLQNIKQREKK